MPDITLNLTALADRLAQEGRERVLVGKIREVVRYHSLRTDLLMAEESIAALDDFTARDDKPRNLAIAEMALISNAIILYARATHSSSEMRSPTDLLSRFSNEERIVYSELVDLRNKAIAHYGSGGSYDGEWTVEIAIALAREGDSRVGVVTRRLTADRFLINRVSGQVTVARTFVEKMYDDRLRLLREEIDRRCEATPEFYKEFWQHPINLDVFLGGPEHGQHARDAFGVGYATGITSR